MPAWALTLSYALHMLATVVWIGGLFTLAVLVLPAARKLGREAYLSLLTGVQRKIDSAGWLSLAVLVGTGLFQTSENPYYEGFLVIGSTWSVAILAKHIVFGAMVLTSAYLTWVVLPKLQRLALAEAKGLPVPAGANKPTFQQMQKTNARLLGLNLALATAVLILTAIARAA